MATNSNLKKMLLEKLFDIGISSLLIGAIIVPISTTIVTKKVEARFDIKSKIVNILSNITSGKTENIIKELDELDYSDRLSGVLSESRNKLINIRNNLLDDKKDLKNTNENINNCYKIIEITNKKIEDNKVNERATFGKYQQEINSLKGEYRTLYIKNYKKNINLIQNNIQKLSDDNEKTKSELLELEKRRKKLQNDINNNYKEIREILENKIKN